jgi:glycerol-3-phosphate dehydrogenase (NAD(P)+)
MQVAMMGSGSWGSACAMVLADAGNSVTMWGRDRAVVDDINLHHRNRVYHPGVRLPDSVTATLDAGQAIESAELVVLALPSQVARAHLEGWHSHLSHNLSYMSLIKGIEINTSLRMSQVIEQVTGTEPSKVSVLSGPNLAKEIAEHQPTATTIACTDETQAKLMQAAFMTDYFRPYWTSDVVGTEIGGAVKNVIALANGIAVGMGLGENTQASLMTRGLAEMARLGVALGADPLTFQGLAGIGDLVATCQSPLSRNRSFGESLGRGLSVEETIKITQQTCEAYRSCQPIIDLAHQHGVSMPITEQVVQVLHFGRSPRELVRAFMTRDIKAETEGVAS